jgi:ectoine hydroxylase-related dioxygenase (phytanoyl-CoA dioxygenase family)
MPRPSIRFWALAVLVFFIAAQLHVWVEAGPAQASGHRCQVCISGAWAIVDARLGLVVALRTLRLEAGPTQFVAKSQRIKASAPRAPPNA